MRRPPPGQIIPSPMRATTAMQSCADHVSVVYGDKRQGKRNVLNVAFDLSPSVAALQTGATDEADDLLGYAILEAYNPDLGDVPEITDPR